MIKKKYMNPTMRVEKTEIISQLMVGSLRSV